MRRVLAVTLLTLLALTSARAAEMPRKVSLNQGGKSLTFYTLGLDRYQLLADGDEIAGARENTPYCVEGKLANLQPGRLVLHGQTFRGVQFEFNPGVRLNAAPGDNIWIAGRISHGGGTVFRISAAARLPSDIEQFRDEWQSLQSRHSAVPVDYLRLAWWLERGKELATGLSEEQFQAYEDAIRDCHRKALDLEEQDLAQPTQQKLASRVGRYRAFVDAAGDDLQGDALWQADLYRDFLKANAAAVAALSAPQPTLDGAAQRKTLADLHHMVGRMRLHYLEDRKKATELFLAGAELDPSHARLAQELRASGYVMDDGRWISQDEQRRLQRERELARQAQAQQAAHERAQTRQREAERARQLTEAKGPLQIRDLVDPLLSTPNDQNLLELAQKLPELAEDAARYALWQAGNLPLAAETLPLLQAGLISAQTQVRRDAIDLLCARSDEPALELLLKGLAKEQDASVRLHCVDSMQQVPGLAGINGLVLLLTQAEIPGDVRTAAAQRLQAETGQTYGTDGLRWKAWWEESRNTFQRKH